MRCEDARDRILDCHLEELTGEVQTELSEHLRGCDDCRRIARAVVAGERGLARALDDAAAAPDEQALELATAGRREASRAEDRRLWRLAVPLAAAAALLLWLLPLEEASREPGSVPGGRELAARQDLPPQVGVRVEGKRQVAVIETRDPQVTVVWFHGETERRTP